MPFTSESARATARKGGLKRWEGKDPATNRTERLSMWLSPTELAMLKERSEKLRISRVELIVRAVEAYNP